MKTEILKVEGMSCGHCVNSVETSLKELSVLAKVDLKNKTVRIEFDEDKISIEKIKESITDQGYDVI